MVDSPTPAARPPDDLTDPRELLLAHLDYYRAALLRKLDGMSEHELRTSRLPSGWAPLALLKHLAFVERRWFRWGFAAEQVDPIWGEDDPDTKKWHVAAEETAQEVRALFEDECARSRAIVAAAGLQEPARSGGGFNPPDHHPALIWILFHMLQEYARHVGHLDVVRELADDADGA
ncbi:Mini-circle protein [Mangrovactinospora gilvigrisea]|uniref:Mini-circle protein n=1 Tax=Mangrovactinospora gilvigrisea TaxID=1428644 RepID=A0A1J7BQB9_9ACTN|nr:DinB family protein [Mangrovactinospora gilvigrisea]OIV35641.1 Mini-circle protein [Mangrovactinospora gilvigrisea]